MMLIPEGTTITAPDDINRVIFTFENHEDAIIFYEIMCLIGSKGANIEVKGIKELEQE